MNRKRWLKWSTILLFLIITIGLIAYLKVINDRKKLASSPEFNDIICKHHITGPSTGVCDALKNYVDPSSKDVNDLGVGGFGNSYHLTEPIDKKQKDAIGHYLTDNTLFLKELDDDISNVETHSNLNTDEYRKYLCNYRVVVRMLADGVNFAIAQEDPKLAKKYLSLSYKFSAAGICRNYLVDNHIYINVTEMWLYSLNRALNNFSFSNEFLNEIQNMLKKRESELKQQFLDSLKSEISKLRNMIISQKIINYGDSSYWFLEDEGKTGIKEYNISIWQQPNELKNLIKIIIPLTKTAIGEQNYRDAARELDTLKQGNNSVCKYFKGLPTLYLRNIQAIALLRCAQVGIAELLYRNENKKWSDTISELSPRFIDASYTIDPFSKTKLLYHKGTFDVNLIFYTSPNRSKTKKYSGIKIFSVEKSLIDNKGNSFSGINGEDKNNLDDITFILLNGKK